MLIAARSAMMTGKRLPYDAEVEYLGVDESFSWIDTGVPGNLPGLRIELECYYSTFARPYAAILGSYIGESYNTTRLILQESDNSCAYGGANSIASPSINVLGFSKSSWHNVVIETTNRTVILDGVVYGPGKIGSENSSHVYLFRSGPNGTTSFTSARISWFKAWQNGTLVRDFIPVRFTNEQNQTEGAMYDRVSGELFRNAGTGAFVIGPDK